MTYRVLLMATGLAYGGAEAQLVNLAIRLKLRGWETTVVSMLPPQAFTEELGSTGISVASLNMRRGIPDPRAIIKLARILHQWQPDVVHSHMVHANLLARVSRLLCYVPVLICTIHSTNEGGRWREIAYRLTDPLADLTTSVSQAGVERYVQEGIVPQDKIKFVPNGVDTVRFKPDRVAGQRLRKELGIVNDFAWLAVGRFETAKDYPNMLRGFGLVAAERADAVLLLAGQGSLLEETKKLTRDLNLEDRVRFLGVRRDVPELMNAADAYVMSSAWEGMPMVLLEAGACGLPIVATNAGGNREVVLDGESGYIVPPGDAEALAAAMGKIMALFKSERTRMGQFGRAHVEANFSLERVVDQWEAIYLEMLARKGLGQRKEREVIAPGTARTEYFPLLPHLSGGKRHSVKNGISNFKSNKR